ncbi:MAG TPA: carboxyltransferase domain-containing protein, partial [Nitrospiraceae bacterium]|nr:carboxyltransferase domain-containing protein [Nitrospiraceae bacterium]
MSDSPLSMAQPFRFLPLGDAALMVEFGHTINPELNAHVITFVEIVRAQRWDGVLDVVPTYCS